MWVSGTATGVADRYNSAAGNSGQRTQIRQDQVRNAFREHARNLNHELQGFCRRIIAQARARDDGLGTGVGECHHLLEGSEIRTRIQGDIDQKLSAAVSINVAFAAAAIQT